MPSTQSAALADLYGSIGSRLAANPEMDLGTMRAIFDELSALASEPTDVTYAEVVTPCGRDLWCLPVDASQKVILYFHGGGFVGNSPQSHRKLAGHLARGTGTRAYLVDYRRTPENAFPAQLDDGLEAYRRLRAEGVAPADIAFAGDSAGGNLAVSLAVRVLAEENETPAAIVAFSPWIDMAIEGATLDVNAGTDALLNVPTLEGMVGMYLGTTTSPRDPLANPLHADLTGLPPVYLTAGQHEVLLDDARRLAARATAAGVDVQLREFPAQQHVFQFMVGNAPEATEAVADAASWLRRTFAEN